MIPARAEAERNIKNAVEGNGGFMLEDYKNKLEKISEKYFFLRKCL